MTMGNGGHISKDAFTGVLRSQVTRRCRRWGDARMIARHLRHTCVSFIQSHIDPTMDVVASLYRSNISRRDSSGSTSMVTTVTSAKLAQSAVVIGITERDIH